jgi:hypothetical protein
MKSKVSKLPCVVEDKRTVRRISIKNIFHSIFEAFNIERGGIYTVKNYS